MHRASWKKKSDAARREGNAGSKCRGDERSSEGRFRVPESGEGQQHLHAREGITEEAHKVRDKNGGGGEERIVDKTANPCLNQAGRGRGSDR